VIFISYCIANVGERSVEIGNCLLEFGMVGSILVGQRDIHGVPVHFEFGMANSFFHNSNTSAQLIWPSGRPTNTLLRASQLLTPFRYLILLSRQGKVVCADAASAWRCTHNELTLTTSLSA